MATTSKVFFRGAASTTSATLYTVSSTSATAIVTNLIITNTTGAAATFTVNLDSTPVASSALIPANSTVIFDLKQVLPASDPAKTITGLASTTGVVFHISGVEIV